MKDIALLRLDGLGGTVTLADQAKKVYQLTGEPVILITRGHENLFLKNPHVKDIINVQKQDWTPCFEHYKDKFDIFCDIRFIVGKWYYNTDYRIPNLREVDWNRWEALYNLFPMLRGPEAKQKHNIDLYDLNQSQIVDMSLGLPFQTIDSFVYAFTPYKKKLPDKFIVINNGVDTHHGKMLQTKMYPYWEELVHLLPLPVIQTGTISDTLIPNVVDLRGKTSLLEFIGVLRKATMTICSEGGTMHLAYAAQCKNVIVIRGPSAGPINKYPGHVTIDSQVCTNCWWGTDTWFRKCALDIKNICMRSISPERVAFAAQKMLSIKEESNN